MADDIFSTFQGRDHGGNAVDFRSLEQGGQKIPQQFVMEYGLMVSRGMIPGHSEMLVVALNPDVDSSINEDLWPGGINWIGPGMSATPWVSIPRIHDIVSTSSNDTLLGSGAQIVLIEGITDWTDTEFTIELINMNGLSLVPTINSYVYCRVRDLVSVGAGATGPGINEGDITASAQVDGTVTDFMQQGMGSTKLGVVAVPSGKKLYLLSGVGQIRRPAATGGAQADIDVLVKLNPASQGPWVDRLPLTLLADGSSHIVINLPVPFEVQGPALVRFRVKDVTDNDTIIKVFLSGVYIDDN